MTDEQITSETIYCPYCGEPLEVLVDRSEVGAQMIEDCQVCCRPIEMRLDYSAGGGVGRLIVARDDGV